MTPSHRRGGGRGRNPDYRPPRSRREHVTAVLGVLAVLAFTVLMVWVLGPHPDSGSSGGGGGSTVPTGASTSTSLDTTPTTVAPG